MVSSFSKIFEKLLKFFSLKTVNVQGMLVNMLRAEGPLHFKVGVLDSFGLQTATKQHV